METKSKGSSVREIGCLDLLAELVGFVSKDEQVKVLVSFVYFLRTGLLKQVTSYNFKFNKEPNFLSLVLDFCPKINSNRTSCLGICSVVGNLHNNRPSILCLRQHDAYTSERTVHTILSTSLTPISSASSAILVANTIGTKSSFSLAFIVKYQTNLFIKSNNTIRALVNKLYYY